MSAAVHQFRFEKKGSVILERWNAERQAQKRAAHRFNSIDTPVFRPQRRSFAASEISRLTAAFGRGDIAINALLESGLALMRTRSREWSRSTEEGRRFLSLCRNNIAGPSGMALQMRSGEYVKDGKGWKWQLDDVANQAIEQHWIKWCRRGGGCDITGRQSFAAMLRTLSETIPRDGEFLVRRVRGIKNSPYRYSLQMLSVDRLDTAYRAIVPGGNEVRMSVEVDSSGKPTGYFLLERNPNDSSALTTASQYRVRYDASDVFHGYVQLEAEQLRGVPWTHAVLIGADMLHGFEESAVVAARVGASHMGFYIPPEEQTGPSDGQLASGRSADGQLMTDAEPGAFEELPPGYDFKSFDAKYPTQAFDPFVRSRKKAMAAGLDVAHHNLTGDMEGVNYSSARIAELAERDNWRGQQFWLIEQFAYPAFCDWLEMSLLAGAITLPNGSALPVAKLQKFIDGVVFRGRGWTWVDPQNDVAANLAALGQGLTTRSQIVGAMGGDFEDNVAELAREAELAAAHKVNFGPVDQPAAPAPAQEPPK